MKLLGLLRRRAAATGAAAAVLAAVALTGCQSDYNGQTLPSPYYMLDDVQYFAPGSEMPLAKEAANLEAQKAEENRRGPAPGP